MELGGLVFFILGFFLGGGLIWLVRQKDIDSVQKHESELKHEFENLEALVTTLETKICYLEQRLAEMEKIGANGAKALDEN